MHEDDRRFEELYARYTKDLVRLIGRRIGNEEDAKEIANDVLLAVRPHLPELPAGGEWPYLWSTAIRRAINHYHRVQRDGQYREVPFEDAAERAERPTAELRLILQEQIAEVCRTFASVFDEFALETRLVFVLDQRGWPSKKIARHLGLSDDAVRSKLKRANRQLEQAFGLEKSR